MRDNFERFISCKSTIDHVLSVLRRGEGGPPAGEGKRAAAAAAAAAESAQTVVRCCVCVILLASLPLSMFRPRPARSA